MYRIQFVLQGCPDCVQPYGPGIRGLTVGPRYPHWTAGGVNRDTHTGKGGQDFPKSERGTGLGSKVSGLIWPDDPDIHGHNCWILPIPCREPGT